jgi:YfiH family protein
MVNGKRSSVFPQWWMPMKTMSSPPALELNADILYKRGMSIGRKSYITVPELEEIPFIVHGFGTRHWTEDDFARKTEMAQFQRLSLKQTHSDIVRVVDVMPDSLLEGDAMVTDRPGILLVISTADCLPLFLVDAEKRAVAAVHCGWKGTVKRVLQKTVKTMRSNFGSAPESVLAAMGPRIAGSCYEVGEDVRFEFIHAGLPRDVFQPHPRRENKYYLDLNKSNRIQLLEMGVQEGNIVSIDLCTHCDKDLLSYRRDWKTSQRLMNFIGLKVQEI